MTSLDEPRYKITVYRPDGSQRHTEEADSFEDLQERLNECQKIFVRGTQNKIIWTVDEKMPSKEDIERMKKRK